MVRKWPFSRLKTGGFLLTRSFVDTDPNTRRVIEDRREAVKRNYGFIIWIHLKSQDGNITVKHNQQSITSRMKSIILG